MNIFSDNQTEGLELYLFKLSIPCYLFVSTIEHDLFSLLNKRYFYSYILVFLSMAFITSLFFWNERSFPKLCINILASSYINAAIYTLPIITFVLGDPKAAIVGNLIQVLAIQSIVITILSFLKNKESSLAQKLLASVSNPLVLMPTIGISLKYFSINPPQSAIMLVKTLGDGASGMALFTFGLALGDVILGINPLEKKVIILIILKNIIHPIMAFFVGYYIFRLNSYWLYSLIITGSAPTGFVVYILAKQFNIEHNLVKQTVMISSIFSLISLIIITMIIGAKT